MDYPVLAFDVTSTDLALLTVEILCSNTRRVQETPDHEQLVRIPVTL